MIAPVFQILSVAPEVTAIIGTAPVRCYPAGQIPQVTTQDSNQFLPCIAWAQISGLPENSLAEPPQLDQLRVQIDCWATTLAVVHILGGAVTRALEPYGYCVAMHGFGFEPETRRYRLTYDFSFFVSR